VIVRGEVLAAIRERKLYRQHYPTFDQYCQRQLRVKRKRGYQLIDSFQVWQDVKSEMSSTAGHLLSEGALLPYVRLETSEKRLTVAKAVMKEAQGGRITRELVSRVANKLYPKPKKEKEPKADMPDELETQKWIGEYVGQFAPANLSRVGAQIHSLTSDYAYYLDEQDAELGRTDPKVRQLRWKDVAMDASLAITRLLELQQEYRDHATEDRADLVIALDLSPAQAVIEAAIKIFANDGWTT